MYYSTTGCKVSKLQPSQDTITHQFSSKHSAVAVFSFAYHVDADTSTGRCVKHHLGTQILEGMKMI